MHNSVNENEAIATATIPSTHNGHGNKTNDRETHNNIREQQSESCGVVLQHSFRKAIFYYSRYPSRHPVSYTGELRCRAIRGTKKKSYLEK